MANELKLPYVRFIRQVSSDTKAVTQWLVTQKETLEALKLAPWRLATASNAEITMPVNAPLTFTLSDVHDTFKMSTAVARSGQQRCHMGMVAYRYTIPADAITGSKYPTLVKVNLGADKFNTGGLRCAVFLSDANTPPTSWDDCREGDSFVADEVINTVTLGVLSSRTTTVATAVNAEGDYTITINPAVSTNHLYLYVILSNYDYESYRASREYYLEGSGILDGANVEVGFASAVTADIPPYLCLFNAISITEKYLLSLTKEYISADSVSQMSCLTHLMSASYSEGADVSEGSELISNIFRRPKDTEVGTVDEIGVTASCFAFPYAYFTSRNPTKLKVNITGTTTIDNVAFKMDVFYMPINTTQEQLTTALEGSGVLAGQFSLTGAVKLLTVPILETISTSTLEYEIASLPKFGKMCILIYPVDYLANELPLGDHGILTGMNFTITME